MIPVGDEVYTDGEGWRRWWHHPVNYALLFSFCLVFFYELYLLLKLGDNAESIILSTWGFRPRTELGSHFLSGSITERALALFSYLLSPNNHGVMRFIVSTFMHANPAHLFGNMLMLYILGDNVENAMGSIRYLIFFLLLGILSWAGFIIFATPESFMPGIGASGAIMGVAGAYWFYFPKARITLLWFDDLTSDMAWRYFNGGWPVIAVNARIVLLIYVLLDLWAVRQLYLHQGDSGVAVLAHVSGFIAGLVLAMPFRKDFLRSIRIRFLPAPPRAARVEELDDKEWRG